MSIKFLLYATHHCEILPAGTVQTQKYHCKVFVLHWSKVLPPTFRCQILECNFGISFICNGLDLNEILSKIWILGSTATLRFVVRKLEKIPKQQYGNLHRYNAAKIHILKVLYYTTRPLSGSNALCMWVSSLVVRGLQGNNHLITYHHDSENESNKKWTTLCCELWIIKLFQKCVMIRAESYLSMTARKPLKCQSLTKFKSTVPLKQHVNVGHKKTQITD